MIAEQQATGTASDAVRTSARDVVEALSSGSAHRSRDEWLTVVGECQALVNTLTAVQDHAIAEVARREPVWCEDGTLGETVHPPGRVSIDGADVVAPLLGSSHAQSQRRVEQAVRVAAGLGPEEVGREDLPEPSGLGGLHAAMRDGRLDAYRVGVVSHELEAAPADVAEAVVAALCDHLDDDPPTLRRRCRRLLARISPELLRQRAVRARAETGLRRWVAEPGVDTWHGTFPSEDAALAWAAIDRLAHELVADGTCSSVEQARGRALTDLVTGNATIEVQVVLTVPADADRGQDAAPVDTDTSDPVDSDTSSDPVDSDTDTGCHDRRHGDDGRDSDDHDRREGTASGPVDPAAPAPGDDDLVQVQGARPSEPLLVRLGWLRDHLPKTPRRGRAARRAAQRARPELVPCDPLTGARLDPGGHLSSDAYRPGPALVALVRARDGHCRFPGCTVAARFCDLDHVRPWPAGRTAADHLMCLCRRHHRIKQRPGWRVRLAPDGTTTWTDPSGRVRTTEALDALDVLVLRADPAVDDHPEHHKDEHPDDRDRPGPAQAAHPQRAPQPTCPPAQSWSALETHLEMRLEHHPTHRRCTSAGQLRPAAGRRRSEVTIPDAPPF